MYKLLPLALVVGLAAGSALADGRPRDALPLLEVIRLVEAERDVAYVKEVEWEEDGYWEIAYVNSNGRAIEIEVDPRTGHIRG